MRKLRKAKGIATRQRRAIYAARKAAAWRRQAAQYRDGGGSARVKISRAKAELKSVGAT